MWWVSRAEPGCLLSFERKIVARAGVIKMAVFKPNTAWPGAWSVGGGPQVPPARPYGSITTTRSFHSWEKWNWLPRKFRSAGGCRGGCPRSQSFKSPEGPFKEMAGTHVAGVALISLDPDQLPPRAADISARGWRPERTGGVGRPGRPGGAGCNSALGHRAGQEPITELPQALECSACSLTFKTHSSPGREAGPACHPGGRRSEDYSRSWAVGSEICLTPTQCSLPA